MKQIKIEKVTLNFGAGKDQSKLEKGMSLIKNITGITPVKTFTNKRIPEWGLRKGLPIGCKLTLRKQKANQLLPKLLDAKDNRIKESWFDKEGNLSFGIHEYIDIPNVEYDPKIGIIGLQVCVTFERPGFRIKRRSFKRRKIPLRHRISRDEAMNFVKQQYKIKIGEEE